MWSRFPHCCGELSSSSSLYTNSKVKPTSLFINSRWNECRIWRQDFYEHIETFVHIRLLCILGNCLFQSHVSLFFPAFMFTSLSISLAALILAAASLPVHVYAFIPAWALCTISVLLVLGPSFASVLTTSRMKIRRMKRARSQLVDADERTLRYTSRLIRCQCPFGFKLGTFCFISVNTAQEIISNSVSYCLLFVSLVNAYS